MKKSLFFVVFFTWAILAVLAFGASSETVDKVKPIKMPAISVSAFLDADPTAYIGRCPAMIHFTGRIQVSRATMVQYQFIRSDGAIAPVRTLRFAAAGSQTVNTSWYLGRDFTGWEAIKILSPVAVKSNKANFSIQCRLPNLAILAFKYEGRLVNAANFPPDRPLDIRMDDLKAVELTIQNAGEGADVTESFSVGLYLSSAYPPGCRPAPIKLWSQTVAGLEAGESATFSTRILIPSTLSHIRYWLYPMVDDTKVITESVEDGNCYTSVPLKSVPR